MNVYHGDMLELYEPAPIWSGEDVFVIGGGPSLKGFDWSRLDGKRLIGCNDAAIILGAERCPVCFFADLKWYDKNKDELQTYVDNGGLVVTHCRQLIPRRIPWLKVMEKQSMGLHNGALGFGGNSGCSAVNLALILGACRVFMLGFDCKLGTTSHWHDRTIGTPQAGHYLRFLQGWKKLAQDLPRVFPDRQVINLTPDSAIPFFPKMALDTFLYQPCH